MKTNKEMAQVKKEVNKILRTLKRNGRMNEYNKLKEILNDKYTEVMDIIYKDDIVEIICKDNFFGFLLKIRVKI